MPVSRDIIDQYIEEAIYDEVGLWMLVNLVKRELHLADAPSIKQATLECVKEMMISGKLAAEFYGDEIGIRWKGSISDLVERISIEWDKLGQEPNIGEIVVLSGAGRNR